MKLEINGKVVEVDDSFANLPPEQQQAIVNEIAAQMSPKEKEGAENALYGIGAGALGGPLLGRPIASFTEGFQKPKTPAAPSAPTPAPTAPTAEAPAKAGAVENWARTQHAGDFYGGQDYAGAHQRAMDVKQGLKEAPGYKALQGSGVIAPESAVQELEARRAAQEAIERRNRMTFGEKFAERNPRTAGVGSRFKSGATNVLQKGVTPFVGRATAGGMSGYQAVDAYNRAKQGDILGAGLSGLGSVGAAASIAPNPKVRAAGALTSILGEAVNRMRNPGIEETKIEAPESLKPFINLFSDRTPEQRAAGGVVGYAKGKQVVQGGLSLAKKFGYDPKKVAQQYPETIPPVLTADKKTGKEFLQKQLSPEALAVQKARKAAQAEIDRGEYTPFFDVSKRSYVNPADYPLQGRTLTDVVPKKAATVEKYAAMASDPAATERLMSAYQRGSQSPMAKDWYAMKQLEDEFVKEFGETEGKRMFRQRFAEPMAATTGGADPNSNLMMTAYTNFMKQQGKDIPINAYDLPFPIGGRYVSGNMDQFRKYNMLGSIPIDNPKRHNFASNFMGYRDRPTIDEQMMGLFDPKKAAPEAGTYGVYEAQLNKLAESVGVPPVNFQDVAWAGAKGYSGKPMMQEINEMIYRTSRITGESPEEVLKGYLRGNKPMYGVGALGGLSAVQETGGVNNPE